MTEVVCRGWALRGSRSRPGLAGGATPCPRQQMGAVSETHRHPGEVPGNRPPRTDACPSEAGGGEGWDTHVCRLAAASPALGEEGATHAAPP